MPRASTIGQSHPTRRTVNKPLIVGLGNLLRGDEGLGVHAARRLSEAWQAPAAVEVVDGGTLGLSLIDPIAQAPALILIDAVNLHRTPGSTEVFVDAAMDRFIVGLETRTAHDINLVDLVHALRLMDQLPTARALIAIQPGSLAWGTTLSPPVDAALAALLPLCRHLVTVLGRSPRRRRITGTDARA